MVDGVGLVPVPWGGCGSAVLVARMGMMTGTEIEVSVPVGGGSDCVVDWCGGDDRSIGVVASLARCGKASADGVDWSVWSVADYLVSWDVELLTSSGSDVG